MVNYKLLIKDVKYSERLISIINLKYVLNLKAVYINLSMFFA